MHGADLSPDSQKAVVDTNEAAPGNTQPSEPGSPVGDASTVAGGSNLVDESTKEAAADDDAIPTLLAPPGAWWEKLRDASEKGPADIVVTASQEASAVVSPSAPRSPTAQTAPASPAPGAAAGDAAAASFAYPMLTTSGGGGLLPNTSGQLAAFGASMSSMPVSPRGASLSVTTAPSFVPQDSLVAGIAAPTRPKAFRVRNRQMKCFLSDPAFLKLVGAPRPAQTVMSGGLAAVDVVAAMLRHVRAEFARQLEAAQQWLTDSHFQVVLANPDGTPDEDMRIVLSGDRSVDSEYVLVVPRPEYGAAAFASLARPRRPQSLRSGEATFEVVVRHESDSLPDNASIDSPGARGATKVRHYTVRVLGDTLVRQLPECLCRRLFLADPSFRAAGTSERTMSARGLADNGLPIEEQTLAFHLNGVDIPVLQCARFNVFGIPAGGPPLGSCTVVQLASAGVKGLSMSTFHRPPLKLRMEAKGSGNSFESERASGGSAGSSFVDRSQDPTSAASNAADMWRVTHMDDIEALAYRSYVVRKRNERKVWQVRLFSVDKDFIYNQMVDDHSSTKRPMRRIVDVDTIAVSNDDPKHCIVQYRRGPDVITSGVVRDELEFESSKECKHFVTKIRILIRLAQQSATSPGRSNAASPNTKQSVSQRFRNLFR